MALRHPADARPGGLLDNRSHLTARSSSSPMLVLSGTTKAKVDQSTKNLRVSLKTTQNENAQCEMKIPRLPDPVLDTYRSGTARSRKSSARSVGASTQAHQIEAGILEDELWTVQTQIDWRKNATSAGNVKRLQETSRPDNWMEKARDVYMKNRFRTQSMDTYSGYSADVFTDSTTPQQFRRVRKEFGTYGEALHHAKSTMRGNF